MRRARRAESVAARRRGGAGRRWHRVTQPLRQAESRAARPILSMYQAAGHWQGCSMPLLTTSGEESIELSMQNRRYLATPFDGPGVAGGQVSAWGGARRRGGADERS